jgi:hypothetical protein
MFERVRIRAAGYQEPRRARDALTFLNRQARAKLTFLNRQARGSMSYGKQWRGPGSSFLHLELTIRKASRCDD